jgi:hypothetical protein
VNDDIDILRKALVRAVVRRRLDESADYCNGKPVDAYLLALVNQDLRQCPSASDLRAQQRRAESAEADWQEAVARLSELERKEEEPESPPATEVEPT